MEIVVFLAGLLIAVAFAGDSLMGCLCVFAAFQFAASIVYVMAQSALH